jgi:hypothetical protein
MAITLEKQLKYVNIQGQAGKGVGREMCVSGTFLPLSVSPTHPSCNFINSEMPGGKRLHEIIGQDIPMKDVMGK